MADETTRRVFLGAVAVASATTGLEGADMEKVTGIGGLFFRAKDPKALAKWYSDHLGIDPVPRAPTIRHGGRRRDPVRFNRSRRKQPTLATIRSSGW